MLITAAPHWPLRCNGRAPSGNESVSRRAEVMLDSRPPTIVLTAPNDHATTVQQSITVTGLVDESVTVVNLTILEDPTKNVVLRKPDNFNGTAFYTPLTLLQNSLNTIHVEAHSTLQSAAVEVRITHDESAEIVTPPTLDTPD